MRPFLLLKATHEELNRAIEKYNTAMDGDSGDDECEAACELRDLVVADITGEAVETQEGIPELLALIREAVGY